MRIKFLTFALAFLALVSCGKEPVINRVPVPGTGEEEEEIVYEGKSDKLNVCSFNIRYYNTSDTYPWSSRKNAAMKFITTEKPDFLGYQEARPEQSQDFYNSLKDEYGMYDISRDTGQSIRGSSGEGVGILYRKDRFKIEDKGFFWLANNPDKLPEKGSDGKYDWGEGHRRIVVWVKAKDMKHSEQTVYFFSTHFDHTSPTARKNSTVLTLKKIKEITKVSDLAKSTTPIFLVGDLNCTYGSDGIVGFNGQMNYARTAAAKTDDGRTYNGFGETSNSIIDHIFYVGNLTPDVYRVVTEDYGVKYISDHYPIIFESTYKK